MIHGLSHVAIAVQDLDSAILQLRKIYGVEPGEIHVNAEQKVRLVYFDLGNCKIELISPTDASSPLSRFLQQNPKGGLHHICFKTGNVGDSIQEITDRGGSIVGDKAPHKNYAGAPIAFIHPDTTCGALVELEEVALSGPISPKPNLL